MIGVIPHTTTTTNPTNPNPNTIVNKTIIIDDPNYIVQYGVTHTYMIVTRDKPKTINFITKLYQLSNTVRQYTYILSILNSNHSGGNDTPTTLATHSSKLPKVLIHNTESQLLDHIQRYEHGYNTGMGLQIEDSEVLYYQMLYILNPVVGDGSSSTNNANNSANNAINSTNSTSSNANKASRSIILTSSYILLCEEMLNSLTVQVNIIDQCTYNEVMAIKPEHHNPLCITIILKEPQHKKKRLSLFGSKSRQWQLVASSTRIIEKLNQEVRRNCIANGNNDVK